MRDEVHEDSYGEVGVDGRACVFVGVDNAAAELEVDDSFVKWVWRVAEGPHLALLDGGFAFVLHLILGDCIGRIYGQHA